MPFERDEGRGENSGKPKRRLSDAGWNDLLTGSKSREEVDAEAEAAERELLTAHIDAKERRMKPVSIRRLVRDAKDETAWRVRRILPDRGLLCVSGHPGVGKSLLCYDLAIALALGEKWLGRFRAEKSRVLFVDQESDEGNLGTQVKKMLRGRDLIGRDLAIEFLVDGGLNFNDIQSVMNFKKVLGSFRPDVVFMDPLVMFHDANENSARDMAEIFRRIRILMKRHNFSAVLLDHMRKPTGEGSAEFSYRGSTAKSAALESHFAVVEKRGYVEIKQIKARYSAKLKPFVIERPKPKGAEIVIRYVGTSDEVFQGGLDPGARVLIMELLKEGNWVFRKDILAASQGKFKERVIDGTLQFLTESAGELECGEFKVGEGRGGKSKRYRLKQKPA